MRDAKTVSRAYCVECREFSGAEKAGETLPVCALCGLRIKDFKLVGVSIGDDPLGDLEAFGGRHDAHTR